MTEMSKLSDHPDDSQTQTSGDETQTLSTERAPKHRLPPSGPLRVYEVDGWRFPVYEITWDPADFLTFLAFNISKLHTMARHATRDTHVVSPHEVALTTMLEIDQEIDRLKETYERILGRLLESREMMKEGENE